MAPRLVRSWRERSVQLLIDNKLAAVGRHNRPMELFVGRHESCALRNLCTANEEEFEEGEELTGGDTRVHTLLTEGCKFD